MEVQQQQQNQELDSIAMSGVQQTNGTEEVLPKIAVKPEDIGKTNLIVNYVPATVTSDDFCNMFKPIGETTNCRIIKDKQSGNSQGFGFVEYIRHSDAVKAIAKYNGLQMDQKTLKVQFARATDDESVETNLYFRSVPMEYDEVRMRALLSNYGHITKMKILVDKSTGKVGGSGFVTFITKKQADSAIKDLNGNKPPGFSESMLLKYADNKKQQQQTNPSPQQPQLQNSSGIVQSGPPQSFNYGQYYGNSSSIPWNSTPGGGPMKTKDFQQPRYNPMGRGAMPLMIGAGAMNQMATNVPPQIPTNFNNSQSLAPALPPIPNVGGQSEICLFVYNLNQNCDESYLLKLFTQYGTVTKVNVVRDPLKNNESKRYGFVSFNNRENAMTAIEQLNGLSLPGFPGPLQVKEKTDKRKQQMYNTKAETV